MSYYKKAKQQVAEDQGWAKFKLHRMHVQYDICMHAIW